MSAHILIIEDEPKLAQFIELELKYEGYQVTVANDGFTGMTAARESETGSDSPRLDAPRNIRVRTLSPFASYWG